MAELTAKLEALGDENGMPLGTKVFRPEAVYAQCRNVAPDLIVYFGDLHWRSVGSVGHSAVWTHDNDTGPDDANHSSQGLCVMSGAGFSSEQRDDLVLYDIAPTILRLFDLPRVEGMRGQARGAS